MKKLLILTAAAGVMLASVAPGVAAQRAVRASDAYASGTADRSGSYNYGPQDAQGRAVAAPVQVEPVSAAQYNRGQNLPYPDRPYGAPDRW